jgi:hypothetical protein
LAVSGLIIKTVSITSQNLGSQIIFIQVIVVNNYTFYVNNLGSQKELEVIETVLIIRPDGGAIKPKRVPRI